MLRVVAAVAALAVGVTAVFAQSAAIGQRQAILKSFGKAAKEISDMSKGDTPFDAAKAQAALKLIAAEAPKLKALFPDDSQAGETKALPAIWSAKADFTPRFDKLAADASASAAAVTDVATLKTEWPKVGANCGGCHKQYRKQD